MAALGFIGTASAKSENGKNTLEEAGIEKAVVKHLRNNRIEQAHRLLDKHDVAYYTGSDSVEGGPDYDSDDVSAEEAQWDGGSSELYSSLVNREDDVWLATNVTEVKWGSGWHARDARYVNDAIGITWDNSEWTSPDMTENNVWLSASGPFDDYVHANYDQYNYYGVAAEINLESGSPVGISDPDFFVNLQTDLIRQNNDDRIGVKAEYEHTYALYPGSIDISIGLAGMSVSIPSFGSSWELEGMAYP